MYHPPTITLSYHAYGQYILYPWGNSINQEPVDKRLIDIAANMSLAMPEGRRYLPMYAREMYSATGDTDDYFYMNLSILPFTIELSTSFRPPDADVPLICDDNLGPALYVLNYTVGAPPPPPPPPPKRALSLRGPPSFNCVPRQVLWFNFTLGNTGDLAEEVTVALASVPGDWTAQVAPGKVNLGAGNNTTIAILLIVPERLPAGETVSFVLRASAASGANASARLNGTVGVGRALNLEIGSQALLKPGQNTSIPVSIKNDGNAYDNISVAALTDTGWPVSQIPSPFELAPWTAANTFVRLQVPEGLPPGITMFNLTFEYWNADGSLRLNRTFPMAVETFLRLAWSVAPSGVVLYEGARQEVSVRLENYGNVREKGNLSLTGDARFASLDRTAVDLQPGESAAFVLSLKGKPGAWKVNISCSSEYGYPDRQVGVGYTIKARPEAPRNTLQDAILVMDLIFVIMLVVYIAYRVRRKRQKGRVPK
jgi:hypothetical protein